MGTYLSIVRRECAGRWSADPFQAERTRGTLASPAHLVAHARGGFSKSRYLARAIPPLSIARSRKRV